ncbi:ATP-binding protein [Mucilaginibacter sp.]|uniref:GAF domain-containing sensor histidine kinase n=1 Tax=Mucilaginibacter sp. TaxID=1882438 RepID=UPI0035BC4A88
MTNIQADIDSISQIDAVTSILEVICRSTGMGFAAVACVTDTKWVACAVHDEIEFGLKPGGELALETTICNEIRQHSKPVVIDHVDKDTLFANHHTPAMYGFQSYISIPIHRKNGEFFGTLCAIDPNPAHVNNPQVIGMFKLFADLIAMHLQALDDSELVKEKLKEAEKVAELRELFIAILGHDLRNPVGAVLNVSQLLLRMPLDDRTKRLAHILQDASYRMKALIENILDFARGHLGEGIQLDLTRDNDMEKVLNQITDELRLLWPNTTIDATYNLTCGVNCDGKRIAQMYSNLLGNALTHGTKGERVSVSVNSGNGEFKIAIANAGIAISDEVRAKLFQPFARGGITHEQEGLGLGLYIASEIARAHQGVIDVESNTDQTKFTFKMPLQSA